MQMRDAAECLKSISANNVSRRKRYSVWQEVLKDSFGLRLRVDSIATFDATLEYANVADVWFFRVTTNGFQVERTPYPAERDGRSYAKIAFQLKGTTHFKQNNRCVSLLPREWMIWDNTKPYCASNAGVSQLLELFVPKERIPIFKGPFDLNEVTPRKFSGLAGLGKLITQFNTTMFEEAAAISDPYASDLADIIVHLVSLTVLEGYNQCARRSPGELLCERIKSNVLENLRDPDLNIARIADGLRCSSRSLHKAFKSEGITLSEYIWRARLLRCYEQLRNNADRKSITQIAFSWGFNSSAHFSTRFKKYFGKSPREYRAGRFGIREECPSDIRFAQVSSSAPT